ncbi:MAG: phosphoglucosamine mutase, partial [Muribaculaceae bacterium]|nr:phosphoglucosamine mutase [Muribaculaceae bacterium]
CNTKVELDPSLNVEPLMETVKERFKDEKITDIDGVKIDFADSWVHLRKSNTEPIIRVYAEAHTDFEAKKLGDSVKNIILEMVK